MKKPKKPDAKATAAFDKISVDELLKRALTYKSEAARWKVVAALHRRDTRETLDRSISLLQSPLVRKRALGADILGQLGYGKTFHNECALALLKRLKFEYSPWVLTSIGVAAGHLNDPRFARPLSDLAKHLDRDVRFGATFGLLCIDSPIAIKSLIKLSSDKVNKVRDWATFGLGSQHEKDNPAIRKALKARLNDKHYETRLEAIAGLAQRKDPTAKAIVLKWLMTRKRVPNIIWESAEDLGLDPKGIRTKAGL